MGGRCDLPSWDLPGRGPSPSSRPTPSLGFRGRRAQARHVPPRRIGRAPAHCNDGAEEVEGVGGLQVVASTQVVQDEARQWPRLLGLPRGPCLRSLPPHALGLACPQRMLLRRFVGHDRRPRAGFKSPGPLRSLLGRHQKLLLRQLLGTLHIVLLHLCGWAAGEAGLLMQRPGREGSRLCSRWDDSGADCRSGCSGVARPPPVSRGRCRRGGPRWCPPISKSNGSVPLLWWKEGPGWDSKHRSGRSCSCSCCHQCARASDASTCSFLGVHVEAAHCCCRGSRPPRSHATGGPPLRAYLHAPPALGDSWAARCCCPPSRPQPSSRQPRARPDQLPRPWQRPWQCPQPHLQEHKQRMHARPHPRLQPHTPAATSVAVATSTVPIAAMPASASVAASAATPTAKFATTRAVPCACAATPGRPVAMSQYRPQPLPQRPLWGLGAQEQVPTCT